MLSITPDDILIGRILKGDKPCFRVLVERYQNLVFTIAFRITRNREEAEEVAQDVFLKVYNGLGGFEGTAKFSSWIYRIAYNTALTKIRNRREAFKDLDYLGGAENSAISPPVLNEAERIFTRDYLNQAINMLEPEEATVISLFYLSEQSLDEIAGILNIEVNAAKVRLHRARKKLREKMELIG
jgi:RNA polymerase sigma-70 factor, ECF subfamily